MTTTTSPAPAGARPRGAGRPPLTPDEAAWIRDHVIPAAIRHNAAALNGCPCDWTGPSSHCMHDAHRQCRSTEPIVYPDGWITWPNGYVASPAPSDDVQVWRVGRPCRMPPCSCTCHTAPPKPAQLDLFGATQ